MTARLVGRNLTVEYGHVRALDQVSLALHAGELSGLVGPNGSGKSTLLRVLLGAERASSGEVTLDGVPLQTLAPRQRARTLTMVVHGAPPDFAMRVKELVGMGRIPHEGRLGATTREDARAIEEAMMDTDVAGLAERTVDTLSAGELQRVHLARVFAQRAPVVLLDEPTANLDPLHQLEAMALLRAFVSRGGCAIVALHDLNLAARMSDRVVVLCEGRLRADGPPEETVTEELLAEVFRVKTRVSRSHGAEALQVVVLEPVAGAHRTGIAPGSAASASSGATKAGEAS